MCTNPITIKTPGSGLLRMVRGSWQPSEVTIPCGKCPECLAKRQNDLASRLYRESLNCKYMYFVTLTYSPEYEPYAATFWHIDRRTGDGVRLTEPFILSESHPQLHAARCFSSCLCEKAKGVTRVYESKILIPFGASAFYAFDSSKNLKPDRFNDLYIRVTPSLNIKHVQDALKRWRINFVRNFGEKLPSFKYALVGEYGTSVTGTHRPHYHLVFVSNELEQWHLQEFLKEWFPGCRTDIKSIPRFNKDGSNAFSLVSRYVGKYVSKGVFDTPSVRLGLARNSRLCTSKGLGRNLTKQEIDYYTCQDIKRFNQDFAHHQLSDEDRRIIIPEIVKRLVFKIVIKFTATQVRELVFGMPLSLKKQIFNWHVDKNTGKACWSSLYYMVADYIRAQFIDNSIEECRALEASRFSASFSETARLFKKIHDYNNKDREQVAFSRMQHYYNTHSKI